MKFPPQITLTTGQFRVINRDTPEEYNDNYAR